MCGQDRGSVKPGLVSRARGVCEEEVELRNEGKKGDMKEEVKEGIKKHIVHAKRKVLF